MNAIKRVLIAVDLSPRSKLVIAAVQQVVPDPDAHLLLTHVVGDLEAEFTLYGRPSGSSDLQSELEKGAHARLEELRSAYLADRPNVEIEVRVGPRWSEIVAAAMKHRAELLFLGAHFVDRAEARAFGDVVQRVTRLSPCPVVVVPTAEDGG